MTPDQSRARRARARARRRRRRIAIASVLALAIAIAALIVTMAPARSHNGRAHAATGAAARARRSGASAPTGRLSQDRLPLAAPALALTGIAAPAEQPIQATFSEPPRAGILFNLDTGQVLWSRNAYTRLRIASLTKMMTALLVVKSAPPDTPVLVTREAVDTAGSKVGVLPLGRHVKLESMLYGLLLPSGNDAAVALAQHVAGSVNAFVRRMNIEAARLGLGCTRYSSPSGYYDQGNYSCAADLAVLAHVDLEQPRIATITRTYTAELPFPIEGGRLYLYNNNPLLIYHYPGTTGLKTGQTEAAGRCLVATAERHGVRLGVVLLHSPAPGNQAAYLLDSAFTQVYHQPPVAAPVMPPSA
ncbi:MAG TPA: D-alanyl-D-alanine carboxypeptidase family protein [Solirubrobacteraceae bacterium]|nr:D-alanyl-D-alanine carboxypeptidase family protein [Solirubrobacteraceae bacterium]